MKTNKKTSPPAPAATDHPTGTPQGVFVRGLFSLVDPPPTLFQHRPAFHSYNLEELKKELAWIEALEKKQKVLFDTVGLREQIRLIELLNIPADGPTLLKWEFEQAGAFQAELMYLLAKQGNPEAFEFFSRKTGDYFWHLKRLAADGHAGALRSLAELAIEATEVVNRHAVKQPEVFRTVASERTHWPFLKSLNKKMDLVKTDDEDSVLRRLHSGKATQQDLAPAKRNDPEKLTAEVAQKLLDYVRKIRKLAQFLNEGVLPGIEKKDLWESVGNLPDAAQDDEAAEMWWKFAKRFLLESYPALSPTSDAKLNEIAPTLLKLAVVNDPKKRRTQILKNIKRKFDFIIAKQPGAARPAY
jgi:hypothetical protein